MPRWLVSFIILVGFLALIGLAFLPRSIHVEVKVDGSYRATGEETRNENAGEAPADAAGPEGGNPGESEAPSL